MADGSPSSGLGPGMVVIPARNEGPRVGAVVRGLRSALPGVPVVVVENGSADDTARAAVHAGATVLHASPGYARALRTGFIHALRQQAGWVVQLDADGQHPPEHVPALLGALAGADLVVGSRFVGEAGYAVPLVRRLAIGALGAWASAWAGQRLRDVTSGMRAWRADALARLVADYPEEIADANVLVRAARLGLVVREHAVPMRERESGVSQHAGPSAALFAARMAWLVAHEGLRGRAGLPGAVRP